jgi:hypothetical protein
MWSKERQERCTLIKLEMKKRCANKYQWNPQEHEGILWKLE